MFAGEGEQLTGEVGGAPRSPRDLRQEFPGLGVKTVIQQCQFGIALDDGQEIIEIVGHPVGQLPDGFHLCAWRS